jgi:TolB-like protein
VWGGKTFVDFERGLNFCIGQIRSALDDDAAAPRYIRTVPRRGYQFIAAVERGGGSSETTKAVSAAREFPVAKAARIGAGALLVMFAVAAGYWLRSFGASRRPPIVAVLRFDNETGNPEATRFSDSLTDNVVEQITASSNGRYEVIGNARILRLPREQRDLSAIASTLHARYVVLGQVQTIGSGTRILAHLIRLPDQTHLWVARMDRSLTDPLSVETEAAQKIASDFSLRIAKDSSGSPLPAAPNQ